MEGDRPTNLQILPRFGDGLTYLYLEHVKVDRRDQAVAAWGEEGVTPIPCASLAALLLGPGTTITHLAVRTLADHGCSIVWTGEEGVRFYGSGIGNTRSAHNLELQATWWADPRKRLHTARRLYAMRFVGEDVRGLSLEQLRGREGARVRRAYRKASESCGVSWTGRSYQQKNWEASDPVNRALSSANACLYGICHAAIVSLGYSPGLGFIHTGKQLSFVYDLADLYKTETSIPVAFATASQGSTDIDRRARLGSRDAFHEIGILDRIVSDLQTIFDTGGFNQESDEEPAAPGGLWDPATHTVAGGKNYADPV